MKRRNVPFGRIVSKHAGEVRLGGNKPVGLTVRAGATLKQCTVNDQCDVWVRPLTAVKWGKGASYDKRTGKLNPARGGVAIPGSRYLTSARAKQLALLRLVPHEVD